MRTFIIAEAGVNHGGSFTVAKELAYEALMCGANAVKFQTYIPSKICRNDDPDFELLTKVALPLDKVKELAEFCRSINIEFMSTPECPETLDFLIKECGIKRIKIGSGDLTNTPLLKAASEYSLPILLSTGMANLNEVCHAIDLLCPVPNKRWLVTVLHCVSCYPTFDKEANLSVVSLFGRMFPKVGYSDHTGGILAAPIAVALGASVIEKHLMLKGDNLCLDVDVSIEPKDFAQMVLNIKTVEDMMGCGAKEPNKKELVLAARVRKGSDGKRGTATQ